MAQLDHYLMDAMVMANWTIFYKLLETEGTYALEMVPCNKCTLTKAIVGSTMDVANF